MQTSYLAFGLLPSGTYVTHQRLHGRPGGADALLHKLLPDARTPHEQIALPARIEATDGEIDVLVHELYGLTEEKIR